MTGTVGIPVIITGQPALKNPQGTKNRLIKWVWGGNLHAVSHHIAATNRPIQKVNTLFGPIVTRDQAVMADQHARISHLAKKLRKTNILAMMGPQVIKAHPKKAGKKARRPLHMAKRNLSVVSQSLESGLTLAISHPQRLPDQTGQEEAHYDDPLYLKNVTVEKATHPRKVVKVR